jgi:translocation and assembly module TamB
MQTARRVLAGIGLVVVWAVSTLFGVVEAALRTDAGRQLVVVEGLRRANAALTGTLAVDSVGGSFLSGLVLRGVMLRDTAGAPVLTVDRLTVRYRWRDFLSGRVSLGQLIIERPRADLIQRAGGERFNFEEVLPRGKPGGGPGPLIAFTDVRISDGYVEIRTPAGNADGRYEVRRVEHLFARLPYLRISSPDPAEDAIAAEIVSLAARVSDPAIGIANMRGRIDIYGDSLTVDLPALTLAETEGALRGTVHWGTDTLLFDLEARARRLVTDEIRGIASEVPGALRGRGDFLIRSLSGDVLEVSGTNLALEGVARGGRLTGRLGVVLGPGDGWTARRTQLRLDNFNLEYVRGFVDTLPLAGRVDGRVEADGPRERLSLTLDVTFRDSLVDGWPATTLRGAGVMELNGQDGAVFHAFQLRESDVALSTVQRLVPGSPFVGRLEASGTLVGPWLDATFVGHLRHQDAPLPPTDADGTLRLDATGAVLGVFADVVFDSLRLLGLSSSFPQLDRDLRFAGQLETAGPLDSLSVTADLAGPLATLRGEGAVYAAEGRAGAHELRVRFGALDLAVLTPDAPATSLAGHLTMRGGVSEGRSPEVRAEIAIDSATLEGLQVDSARTVVSLGDSVLTLNTFRAWAGNLIMRGGGRIGLASPRSGTLTLAAEADSIGILDPWLEPWLGPLRPEDLRLQGALGGSITLEGALDAFTAEAAFQATELRRGEYYVSRVSGSLAWSSDRQLSVAADVDSLDIGGVGFGAGELRGAGGLDSLGWFARSRFGGDGAWLGGGFLERDSSVTRVAFDSLGVLLGTHIWFAEGGAVVSVSDSGVDFSDVLLTSVQHAGRVRVSGRLPFAGPGALSASIEALPVTDVWVLFQHAPESVTGEVNGTLELSGRARDPEIDMRLDLRDAAFGEFRAPVVRAEATYRARRLAGRVTLHRAGEEILNVNVELPVDLAITGVERRRLPGRVNVRARAQGVDLALLEATTPNVRGVSGTLDADFGITGTWERPELTGRVEVKNGTAGFPALGVRHEQLDVALQLSGDTIAIERFMARSGQGTAQISGFVRLQELSRAILQLHISGQNFRAIDVRDFLTLTASGELDLTGPFLSATLTGSATANRGVLYFADLIEKDVINLQDTLYREFLDTLEIQRLGLGPELESRFLDSLRVDSVRVEMGSDMWMRSSEANIQLTGTVTLNKARNQYRLFGTLQTPRGTYRLAVPGVSREFTVTRGQVRYFGTSDLDADLDIDAQHVVRTVRGDEVTVFVHIGGTLYEPDLTLSSDIRPAVSETEIISYLLFGAPSVQSVATGGAAARAGIQSLASIIGGQVESALVQDIGIPVDYFQVRPGEVRGGLAGTEIAVGWQIRFLGTSAFLTTPVRYCPERGAIRLGASLEFRLSRDWLFATTVDPSRSCAAVGSAAEVYQFGLDVFWEKSF